ncbi:MAG: hypothetical protein GY757_01555, partial [bacterium]|nr:hypothetical protein [bacterium]
VKTVRKAIYCNGHTYEPAHLAVIHKLVGKNNIYMNMLVTMPVNKEMVFPGRVPFYNEIGQKRGIKHPEFRFIFDDPGEIYHLF